MKYFSIALISAGLLVGGAGAPFAFALGGGGAATQRKSGQQGKKAGPRDGSGAQKGQGQKGQGQKGKRTGPKDGSGPIHTPPPPPTT
ncbi:MAG: hypothetical protein ABI972_14140 [Acidobacteriota bacterium]